MAVSRGISDLYQDQYAGGSHDQWRRLGALGKADNIVRAWNARHGGSKPSVVEIGCGDGAVAQRLSELGFYSTYRGYDLSASGIDECRQRDIPGADFQLVAGDRIPLDDDACDVVVMTHVVEHLENPRGLIMEARRIATELIVEVPMELNVRLPKDYDWRPVGHINKYNRVTIRQLVQTCGYDVEEQFTTNPALDLALYLDSSKKSRAQWMVKESLLRAVPGLARNAFTYHETLLARRADHKHSASVDASGGGRH